MGQWIGHVGLWQISCEEEVQQLPAANFAMGYKQAMKIGLKARGGNLTVKLVTGQILATESEMMEETNNVNIQREQLKFYYDSGTWNRDCGTNHLANNLGKTPAYISSPRPRQLSSLQQ